MTSFPTAKVIVAAVKFSEKKKLNRGVFLTFLLHFPIGHFTFFAEKGKQIYVAVKLGYRASVLLIKTVVL